MKKNKSAKINTDAELKAILENEEEASKVSGSMRRRQRRILVVKYFGRLYHSGKDHEYRNAFYNPVLFDSVNFM